MTITAAQIRQACVLLRWRSPRLSRRTRVPYDVARNARTDEAMPTVSIMDVWAIRGALERAGVQFGPNADGEPSATRSTTA